MALRVWCLIANPSDLTHFDDEGIWKELTDCLRPWTDNGAIIVGRSAHATESGLREAATQEWSVLHFIGHAQTRAAGYGTLALLAADGRARNLTAPAFANLVAKSSFRAVVLEACEEASFCFDALAHAVAERNLAVIVVPNLNGTQRRRLLSKLYAGLTEGASGGILAQELAATTQGAARVITRHLGQPLIEGRAQAPMATAAPEPEAAPTLAPTARQARSAMLDHKRAEGAFDVFVCYHSTDRPAVQGIAKRLKNAGVLPWLDAWELAPGQDWQDCVEDQVSKVHSAAVFYGASGQGPWQEREVRALLEQFVERKAPIIPVLLPDAPLKPDLPLFLRSLVWVDFRSNDPDPFDQLLWGITGKRPED